MQQHPIAKLVQKIESHYANEIQKHFSVSKKQRVEKLYKLIATAKNEEQLDKSLLFKKLFGKSYSKKIDYLWRNEIRLLKEELEKFLIQKEQEFISKNNEAYNKWLLTQAYDKLKYTEGISECYEFLTKNKANFASYGYTLDAIVIQLNVLNLSIEDVTCRIETYPKILDEANDVLKDLIAAYLAKINLQVGYYNWLHFYHQNEQKNEPKYKLNINRQKFEIDIPQNPISEFYNHFAQAIIPNNYEAQIQSTDKAIKNIEQIYNFNKLFKEQRFLIYMSKGREMSANGYFLEAHDVLHKIKQDVGLMNMQIQTSFFVNYITNLVKSKFFKEALFVIENEFSTEHLMYKNMILQSRLLCYLYLRDTKNLSQYISYDLDAAPFPINYMLKVIKSAYFYLMNDFETALNIINSIINSKSITDKMPHYTPIFSLYKKLYTIKSKNNISKIIPAKHQLILKNCVLDIEDNTILEIKFVSIYQWIKNEIEQNIIK